MVRTTLGQLTQLLPAILLKKWGFASTPLGWQRQADSACAECLWSNSIQAVQGGFNEALLQQIANPWRSVLPSFGSKRVGADLTTIDQLEKTEFTDYNYREYRELAFPIIKAALLLLVAGVFLDKYYYLQIP